MVWQQENRLSYEDFIEKYRTVLIVFIGFFLFLSLRLFQLQVIQGNYYKNLSEQQRTQVILERAPRGVIYDAEGIPMVGNKTSFVALFYPFSQDKEPSKEMIKKLGKAIEDPDVANKILKSWNTGQVVKLLKDVTRPQMFKLLEQRLVFPGLSVLREAKREYFDPEANSHLCGYLSEITKKELESFAVQEGYKMGDWFGRRGLEQVYDASLRGTDGGWQTEVDVYGHQTKMVKHIPATHGNSLYTTVDSRLQKVAYDALKASSSGKGAVVGIDPRSGAIKVLVSCPGYDSNLSFESEFGKYVVSKELALFNRCVQALYAPGSAFKIIPFVAALNERKVSLDTVYTCSGKYTYGNKTFGCWEKRGHGRQNFTQALANSCNVYFYQAGLKIGPKLITDYAKKFELGKLTGIETLGEKAGLVPSEEWKKEKLNEAWHPGDTINIAIGQGPLWVTPIQMAQLMSIVACKGNIYQLHILDKIVSQKGEVLAKYEKVKKGEVNLKEDVWQALFYGLEEVVKNGTARACYFPNLRVAAKTGTAQNPHGQDHAWIVSYAPVENPQLALCVVVENGGGGGAIAGPIARAIYEDYFLNRSTNAVTAQKPKPVKKITLPDESMTASENSVAHSSAPAQNIFGLPKNKNSLDLYNGDNNIFGAEGE